MTDEELLELAAKAAGSDFSSKLIPEVQGKRKGPFILKGSRWVQWNPLTDDGDALRLAVRLYLDINQFPATDGYVGMIEIWRNGDGDPAHVEYVKAGDDRLIATRRAIVCVAAEIGRNMK